MEDAVIIGKVMWPEDGETVRVWFNDTDAVDGCEYGLGFRVAPEEKKDKPWRVSPIGMIDMVDLKDKDIFAWQELPEDFFDLKVEINQER